MTVVLERNLYGWPRTRHAPRGEIRDLRRLVTLKKSSAYRGRQSALASLVWSGDDIQPLC